MIRYNYETNFELEDETVFSNWLNQIVLSENKVLGEINYIFCNDDYLHKINVEYLNHDTLTDIISFDYSEGNLVQGDIFISIERVRENAHNFEVSFKNELLRVMAHGVLHYCGYKDKSDTDAGIMRKKEDEKIQMFHVEQ
ncbi:rRNA maturation RNase YbeY [Flavobacterium sp.]|uniref:rRNA maturation RNase YbeY n=1 Tax=Flavobacterium sp. TaxID=239 RepID=UPI0035294795